MRGPERRDWDFATFLTFSVIMWAAMGDWTKSEPAPARRTESDLDDLDEPRDDGARGPRQRTCLMCGRSFESEGAHNRICRRCKASQTYRSG